MLSYYFFTNQQGDLATLRQQAPDAAFYVEMCHTTANAYQAVSASGYDDFLYRRTTREQYCTTAHVAYARGFQGVSTFNFVYYREHGIGNRGPFHEPPFEIHKGCGDPSFVARQDQHYFIGRTWEEPRDGRFQINRSPIAPGETATFSLNMAPPEEGWTADGKLRIQSLEPLGDSRWAAQVNGVPLVETEDRSEPYASPYPNLLGTPEQLRAWIMPADLCRDGDNAVDLTLLENDSPVPMFFLDVAMPAVV